MKAIFILLTVLFVVISFALSKRVKTGKDLLVPAEGLPFVIVAFTMAASQFGSSMLIGGVQQAAEQEIGEGFWPAIYTLIAASASCFLNVLIAPRFRKMDGTVTPPDFIEFRYGHSCFLRGYHSVVYICSVTAILISQIVGFAGMGHAFGFSYESSAIFCTIVICLMAMGSGMIGVAVTDAIQYVLIILLLCGTIPVSLNALRKVGITFGELVREPFFSSGDQKARFFYTAWPMIIGNLFSYEYFMRFMSCKGLKEAKKASLLAGIFLLIAALPVALLGAVANACYQNVAADEVFGMILKNELPPTIRILLMAAVLMAILTSADSMLTSVSGMISRDLYAGLILKNKPVTEVRNFRFIIKVSMVVVAAVAAICALHFTQILQITFFFSPLTSGVMFAPMIIGLFWKKASRKGAVLSVITGAMAALLHITGIVTLFDRVAGPALVGSVALIVFSLLFPD